MTPLAELSPLSCSSLNELLSRAATTEMSRSLSWGIPVISYSMLEPPASWIPFISLCFTLSFQWHSSLSGFSERMGWHKCLRYYISENSFILTSHFTDHEHLLGNHFHVGHLRLLSFIVFVAFGLETHALQFWKIFFNNILTNHFLFFLGFLLVVRPLDLLLNFLFFPLTLYMTLCFHSSNTSTEF